MAAAAFKGINARIRSNKTLDYLFSTHFLGPASNFGIPLAAVMDTQKDPEIISGRMTAALTVYSATFMRYALAVTPQNYLLFACHFINCSAQITQGYRYMSYWNWGGREASLASKAKAEGAQLGGDAKAAAQDVATQAKQVAGKAKEKLSQK